MDFKYWVDNINGILYLSYRFKNQFQFNIENIKLSEYENGFSWIQILIWIEYSSSN